MCEDLLYDPRVFNTGCDLLDDLAALVKMQSLKEPLKTPNDRW